MIPLNYMTFVLMAIAIVPLSWAGPSRHVGLAIAIWTAVALALLSPASLLWLGVIAIGLPLAMAKSPAHFRGSVTLFLCLALVAGLVLSRSLPTLSWLGGAFFTLRALHVTLDWWMGRLPALGLRASIEYFFFLPLLAVGPINRVQHFQNQMRRRRWDSARFARGFDRLLLGLLFYFVVSGQFLDRQLRYAADALEVWPRFCAEWLLSALSWVDLFFAFSGSAHIALSISMMCGLTLEENFNRPWQARNLIEFWQRWHISLTSWVHDYVYRPIVSLTRNPIVGLLFSMLVIGLWHAFSIYYTLWAVWQSLGILLSRVVLLKQVPGPVVRFLGPLGVLAWLSAARPVLDLIGVQP